MCRGNWENQAAKRVLSYNIVGICRHLTRLIFGQEIAADELKEPDVPRGLRNAAKVETYVSDCYATMPDEAAPATSFVDYTGLIVKGGSGSKKNRNKKRKRSDDDIGDKDDQLVAQDDV